MKTTRKFSTTPRRRAMTLIEIMAAILVLSIGLVGVLAAIPFGGFRIEQMNEADCAAALGRNAVRMMKANGWAKPDEWNWFNRTQEGRFIANSTSSILDTGNFNLVYPYFIDPLGKIETDDYLYRPTFQNIQPTGGFGFTMTRVFPRMPAYGTYDHWTFDNNFYYNAGTDATFASVLSFLRTRSLSLRERNFYLQDDIFYGVTETEDATEFRPRLEVESEAVLDAGDIPAFSGRYSWLATVSLDSNTSPITDCPAKDVSLAEFDVAVFKNRIIGDEKAFRATVDGSGFQGGSVTIDLTSAGLLPSDRERVVDQFETTRYLMLIGTDDRGMRSFAKWYRIANYSVVSSDGNGPATLRATLIGQNTPNVWANGNVSVSALFFPGVVGVYSSSTTF